ncbi:MAG: ABATE domain-containing protein [Blastocatellia bacterium]|nr:ABATE domain-containing protein [Blastocatellia bacterium]
MVETRKASGYIFVGGHLCLDFVNTEVIRDGGPLDLLRDFDDLISWLVQAQVIDKSEAREALEKWSGKREGIRAFEEALRFRAVLRNLVERIAKGKSVQQSAIDAINNLLGSRPGYLQIKRVRGGFERHVHAETVEPVHLLVPIAMSASELLCYVDLSRIKKCKNPDCVIFFCDTTKNQARNWCSMSACGNRMKVAAHYYRKRSKK